MNTHWLRDADGETPLWARSAAAMRATARVQSRVEQPGGTHEKAIHGVFTEALDRREAHGHIVETNDDHLQHALDLGYIQGLCWAWGECVEGPLPAALKRRTRKLLVQNK